MITQFFGATYFLSRTTEDYKHLKIILEWRVKKESFTLQKCFERSDRHIMKIQRNFFFFKQRAFYRLNQRIIPSRSEDIIFSVLTSSDTTIDDKHLKIISQWRLRHVIEKEAFSLQKM